MSREEIRHLRRIADFNLMIMGSIFIALFLFFGMVIVMETYYPITWTQHTGTITDIQHYNLNSGGCSKNEPCVWFRISYDSKVTGTVEVIGYDTPSWKNGDLVCVNVSNENVFQFLGPGACH